MGDAFGVWSWGAGVGGRLGLLADTGFAKFANVQGGEGGDWAELKLGSIRQFTI